MSLHHFSGDLALALKKLSIAVYTARLDEHNALCLAWESGCEHLTGYSAEELADTGSVQRLFDSIYKDWHYHILKVFVFGTDYQWEHVIQTPGGERVVRHHLAVSGDGHVLGLLQAAAPLAVSKDVGLQLDMLENLPVGVSLIDRDFRVQWTNALGTSQSHFNWKNHYGEVCYSLPVGREKPCDNCPVPRCLQDGSAGAGELPLPGGGTWLVNARPVYDREAKQIGAIKVVTDVTEQVNQRNEALEKLGRREARLQAQNDALISLYSHPAVINGTLEDAARVLTKTAAETLKANIVRLWVRQRGRYRCLDNYDREKDAHSRSVTVPPNLLVLYEHNIYLERQFIVGDTRLADFPADVLGHYESLGIRALLYCPIRLNGEVVGAVGIGRPAPCRWSLEEQAFGGSLADFAAERISREHLKESRHRMDALLANIHGAAFRLRRDKAGPVLEFLSDGCLALTGYAAADLVENAVLNVLDIVVPEDRQILIDAAGQAADMGAPVEAVFRIIRKDGRKRWMRQRSRRVKSPDGDRRPVFEGFFHDITEHFELKEARQINKAKNDFMAAMSHEIRTPVNTVLGLSHLASKTDLSDKQRDYLNKIDAAAANLLRIVNDISDYAQLDSGKAAINAELFYLHDLLRELEEKYLPLAEAKGLALLGIHNSGTPNGVVGDRARVKQVLELLLHNSLAYTEQGRITLGCASVLHGDNSIGLAFTVTDTGVGMNEKDIARIFTAFSQAGDSLARSRSGTGLGMTIALKLSKLMGGDILVRSMPGEGTVIKFTCCLNLPETVPAPGGYGMPEVAPRFHGQNILLVEDNPISQQIGTELLENVNLRVHVAANGKEAVEMVAGREGNNQFSLVLMDLQMPVMDGYEATRSIRERPGCRDLPIIAVTAVALEADYRRCLEMGMVGYIRKPIDVDKLYSVLQHFLDFGT